MLFRPVCPARGRNRRAFSLVEVLVVIAIIAILAAILFPVFAQVRAKARQIQCLSNLKQIALGVLMYMQDHDDIFPSGLMLAVPGSACLATSDPWACMYAHVPATARSIAGNCTGPSPPFTCSFYYFRDFTGQFRPSVAQQIWSYVKSERVFYDPDDPTGDRFASGRWAGPMMVSSYMWVAGPSLGNMDCLSSASPFSLGVVAAPSKLQMVQDAWVDMHTYGVRQKRWNIAFLDGHAKLTLYIDREAKCWFQGGVRGGPWAWNYCNPHDPQDVSTRLPRRPPYCN
ncbi:MAG: prepilin-type N-terminal cleavage/methylation domain-containing protein [Armatimonadetes bacterium]|nr:prepilin-type N-terminal cleavage/methylation domain-containing protein [Armatimonadota bacterium]